MYTTVMNSAVQGQILKKPALTNYITFIIFNDTFTFQSSKSVMKNCSFPNISWGPLIVSNVNKNLVAPGKKTPQMNKNEYLNDRWLTDAVSNKFYMAPINA